MPNKRRDAYYTLGGTLLILVLWQVLAWLGGTGFLLPSPARVLSRFFDLFTQPAAWQTVLTSAGRIIPSILLAIGLAILFAWLASRLRPLRFILAPLILVMKAVPIVSFILIALFFMGETFLTIFICSLIVFPLVYSQLLSAFLNVDPGLLEMGRVFSLSRRESIRYIVIPGCLETFLAAVSVAVGMAWKAGVAAEVLAFARGTMGRHMHEAKLYLDMEKLLAWTLALVLVAFLSEQLMVGLFRRLLTFIGQNLPRLKEARTGKALKTRSQLLDDEGVAWEGQALCPLEDQAIRVRGLLSVKSDPQGPDAPVIRIRDLSKCFDSSYVFSQYEATLPLDRPLVIIGPSGVGKTTLMRMMAGLIRPDSGTIEGVPERGVFVFQDNRLLPQLSARDNIRLVLPGYEETRADQLLEALGLTSVCDQAAATLSGGEKRRLSLARALAPESDILYLDEAFRELDEKHESEALALLLDMARDKALVMATHDLTLIDRMKANVLELRK